MRKFAHASSPRLENLINHNQKGNDSKPGVIARRALSSIGKPIIYASFVRKTLTLSLVKALTGYGVLDSIISIELNSLRENCTCDKICHWHDGRGLPKSI